MSQTRLSPRWLVSGARVHLLGGIAFALVITAVWMLQAGGGFVFTRFALLMVVSIWPVIMALDLVAVSRRRERFGLAVAYAACLLVLGAVGVARNPEFALGQLALLWLISNGPPTVLLLTFMRRRVRAVGPLVVSFLLVAIAGSLIATSALGTSDTALRALVEVGVLAGLGATELFLGINLVGLATFALLGWFLLRRLGEAYRRRRVGDQGLTLDAMWMTFAVVHGSMFASAGWPWFFASLGAFLAYWTVTRAHFLLLRERTADHGLSLLLLRVFALGPRSESALDVLAKRWRWVGTIELIAGPDLVTSTVEPHEFLDFIAGRLSRRFVQGARDLEERVASRDRGRDPDGRYRVNEFFCHADTWQLTMSRLAADANAVLMDLRSFSRTNQGCTYELGQLLATVPLDRVVLVEDMTTDAAFLQETLESLWARIRVTSPNWAHSQPTIRVFRLDNRPAEQMALLVRMLLRVASDVSEPQRRAVAAH